MGRQEGKSETNYSTASPVFSDGKYIHPHSRREASVNLRSLSGTEGIWPSAELHPQLRFIAAPTRLTPFQQFSFVLEITDLLGGTMSALRLFEVLRLRQQEKYSLLPDKLRDSLPLPPVDLVISTESCKYGMQSDEYFMNQNSNNKDNHYETHPLIIKCSSPFSNMRYGDGASLSSAIMTRTLAPPFGTISGILTDPHMEGSAISRVSNSSNNQTKWVAFEFSEPCVAAYPPQATQCGVQFRVCC
ncbi:hypothetical protein LSM04_008410 [Trypanosoma melophagium]|uniref:uncharacterized protein n=1 Tax=Trypanosoma melophagium TaxID=715481 RepID=UPI00351A5108|nr:hypothetical protein LSM04_008410 [Trypanosoma melophagium]